MKRKPAHRAAEDASYEIGYGKPPKHTRFKPGQSGHPSGRPRGQRNFRTAVKEALQEKVAIREGDRQRKLSKMDAIIQVALTKALRGDAKGLAAIVQLARWAGLMDEQPEQSSTESVGAEDEAILAGYLERHGLKPSENPPGEADEVSDTTAKKKNPEDKR